jgi:hypothetical protein
MFDYLLPAACSLGLHMHGLHDRLHRLNAALLSAVGAKPH